MRDLKIKPSMDTPKAKLKNPAPKDADSILKKHMDKRQQEKEPESRDPVRYANDRVEKNMRHGASGAADASRRMTKHYRGKLRQGKENAAREYRVADMGIGAESGSMSVILRLWQPEPCMTKTVFRTFASMKKRYAGCEPS